MAQAIFAAGCFWGVEYAFAHTDGVTATAVGYTGGRTSEPSYEQICGGQTGHAEAVRVDFDPAKISYDKLLDLFWQVHDPTQVNRQGVDVGTQYRSAIFTLDDEQAAAAEASMEATARKFRIPIATEIAPAETFWPAEEYHQKYIDKQRQAASPGGPRGSSGGGARGGGLLGALFGR